MVVGVSAVLAHSDRQVSLEGNALGTGVLDLGAELLVQMELNPFVVLRLVAIPPCAEFCVLVQPVGILLDELPAGRALEVLLSAGLKSLAHKGHLGLVHARIVDFRQRVEGLLLLLEGGSLLDSEVLEVDVNRMQGKAAHRAIWIAVLPLALAGGVIDWENLDYALSGLYRPVNQVFEVMELSNTEVLFAAKREHRHCGARTAESCAVKLRRLVCARKRTSRDRAVVPTVSDDQLPGACGRLGAVVVPFDAVNQTVLHQNIAIIFESCDADLVEGKRPDRAVGPAHWIFLVGEHEGKALAPLGPVLYFKCNFHFILSEV